VDGAAQVDQRIAWLETDAFFSRSVEGCIQIPKMTPRHDASGACFFVEVPQGDENRYLEWNPEPLGVAPVFVVTMKHLGRLTGTNENCFGLTQPVVATRGAKNLVADAQEYRIDEHRRGKRGRLGHQGLDSHGIATVEGAIKPRAKARRTILNVRLQLTLDTDDYFRSQQTFEHDRPVDVERINGTMQR
jgi:hypothetical protein